MLATADGQTFVVTGGGDGQIRTWRFDAATRNFVQMATLEGHTRPITSLLLSGIFEFNMHALVYLILLYFNYYLPSIN